MRPPYTVNPYRPQALVCYGEDDLVTFNRFFSDELTTLYVSEYFQSRIPLHRESKSQLF